jgi:peptidylprolyl isomerase
MLVLTRQAGEKILIDGAICVTLVAVKGNSVRLGVAAPPSVPVDRWEVHERRRAPGAGSPTLSASPASGGESSGRTAQPGDHVQVHYLIRSQDGSAVSSRGRAPLELTVGMAHPRLPGLGLALVGLAPGEGAKLTVPPERANDPSDPARVHVWSRQRFPPHVTLRAGKWVRFTDDRGRLRHVRILQVRSKVVVIDANHPWAGQTLELEVELIWIQAAHAGSDVPAPEGEQAANLGRGAGQGGDA